MGLFNRNREEAKKAYDESKKAIKAHNCSVQKNKSKIIQNHKDTHAKINSVRKNFEFTQY